MARSTYIYVLYRGMAVIGAFTVKHEMQYYRDKCKFPTTCWRFRDGDPAERFVEIK